MENPVRRVRCPRCRSVLEEPGAPVYQCGGCGTTLRAKNRTGSAGDAARASPSRSGLPPQSRQPDASDVASTSRSSTPTPPHVGSTGTPTPPHVASTSRSSTPTPPHVGSTGTPTPPHVASTSRSSTPAPPHVETSWHRATDATGSRHGSGDLVLVSAGTRGSGDVASTSSTPDATASSRRQGTDATSRRESGGVVVSTARSRGSGDVASTSSTPGANATAGSGRPGADTTSRDDSSGPAPARNRVSEQVALIENRGREQSTASQDAGGAEPGVGGASFSGGNKDVSPELQDDKEKGMKRQAESTDAARKKHSGEAAVQPHYNHDQRQEPVPKSSAQSAAAQPARDDADAAGEKVPSPSRHELQEEHLGPLRKKILKTVDELKGDLSELFNKSPELNPPRARPPRLSKQEGYVSRAAASGIPARARHVAAATDGHRGHHGSGARVVKPRQAAAPPRGLPSRRYRQCRAHPCFHDLEPRPCHHGHGCCHHHGKPECSSCRGYCCRPRAQEPSSAPRKPPAAKEPKRRPPPRNHCRPVLKGAPFIICFSCFKLVQVPADFAVSTKTMRKLRCGSCSTVLSYSYRDPARKKDSVDRWSTDGSELHGGKGDLRSDPFAPFIDAFGLSSYSTEDEQRLPVSRNTSFDTLDGTKRVGRLHRLMGYGSASELLRHSPDLYESFSERTTPDVRQHDTKGKGVYIDDDDYDVDDSDEEDIGALKRSAGKGSGWPLQWMPGKGTPAAGAIRIK